MGEKEIKNKLDKNLQEIPKEEENVIYVLSRIRKLLEKDNYPDKYAVLNFYCNLALHSKINKQPKVIKEMFKRIAEDKNYSNSIIGFNDLHKNLKEFLKEKNLPNFYKDTSDSDIQEFNKILNDIYSQTPITVSVESYEIEVDKKGGIFLKRK